MQRYHKSLYFPQVNKLKALIEALNGKKWQASSHSLDRIQEKASIDAIGEFLRELTLTEKDCFEFWQNAFGNIEKILFRIDFDGQKDIILALTSEKRLVTIFFNQKQDNHKSLNPSNYTLA